MSLKKKVEPGLRIVRIFPHSTYSYTIFQLKPVHRSASLTFSPVYHAHMNPSASSKYVRGALSMNLSASSIYVRGALSMNPSASLVSNQLLTRTTMAPHSLLIINLFYTNVLFRHQPKQPNNFPPVPSTSRGTVRSALPPL